MGAELLTSTTDFIGIKAVKFTYTTAIGISCEWTKLTAEEGFGFNVDSHLVPHYSHPSEKIAFLLQRLGTYPYYPRS